MPEATAGENAGAATDSAGDTAAGTAGTAATAGGSSKRSALIGVAAGAAVVLIAAGAFAIGSAVSGGNGDSAATQTESTEDPGASADQGEPEAPPESGAATDAGGETSEADALVAAIDAAVAEAGGTGAVKIEVEGDGWEVEVRMPDGTETDVDVSRDGVATVRETDDDRGDDPLIDTAQIPEIVSISVEAAGGGTIESIETDDDEMRYEVHVGSDDGEVEIELSSSLEVLSVDRD